MNKYTKLLFWILLSEGGGVVSSIFTISAIPTWYQALNKPFFNPPNYVFGPVWTTLYALMGISIYLVLEKAQNKNRSFLIKVFLLQLFLNFLWSFIFFGLHAPLLAFLDIMLLLLNIAYLTIVFWKYSKPASYLLIPYFLWVCFATSLNLSIVLLN